MNSKGQMGLAIISALAVFIVGFAILNLVLPEVSTFRADMGCDSVATLSDGGKLTCLVGADLTIPLIILGILSLAVGGITSRLNI